MSYSDVANPLVGMLKFCIKSITSAMLSASLYFGLIASKRNCGKLNTRRPVESEFSIFGIVLQRPLSQNYHVLTYGKQGFTSCLPLMQSDL